MLITNEDIVGMFFLGYNIVNSIMTFYYMAMHVRSLIDQTSEGFIRHGQKAL